MSKTTDWVIEKYNKEIEDLYNEHSQHLVFEHKCSECAKNPPEVCLDDEGYIRLIESELQPPMTNGDVEQISIEEAIAKKLEEDSCEVEQLRDDYDPTL